MPNDIYNFSISSRHRDYTIWKNPFDFEINNTAKNIDCVDSIITNGSYNNKQIILKWKSLNFLAKVQLKFKTGKTLLIFFPKNYPIFLEFYNLNYFKNFYIDKYKIIESEYIGNDLFLCTLENDINFESKELILKYESFIENKTSIIFIPLFFEDLKKFNNLYLFNDELHKGIKIDKIVDNYCICKDFPKDWDKDGYFSLRSSEPKFIFKIKESSHYSTTTENNLNQDYLDNFLYSFYSDEICKIHDIIKKGNTTLIKHSYKNVPFNIDESVEILNNKHAKYFPILEDTELSQLKGLFYIFGFYISIPNIQLYNNKYINEFNSIFLNLSAINSFFKKTVNNRNFEYHIELFFDKVINNYTIFKSTLHSNVQIERKNFNCLSFKIYDSDGVILSFKKKESLDYFENSFDNNILINFKIKCENK